MNKISPTTHLKNHKDTIFIYFSLFTTFLDKIIDSSKTIYKKAEADQIEDLSLETENRNRLLSILRNSKIIVDRLLQENESDSPLKIILDELIFDWEEDRRKHFIELQELDKKTMLILENLKHSVQKQIAIEFSTKKKIMGYNLVSVKNNY